MVFEDNVRGSFRRVKEDMMRMDAQLIEISSKQFEILGLLRRLEGKEEVLEEGLENAKKSGVVKKTFIAAKTGKSFHVPSCVFAKNILPKSKIVFKTKDAALNKGYKACDCVKKY